jgi:hypothetical protein
MSMTKRVWIEKDPDYEDVRQKAAEEFCDYADQFSHRIPMRRFRSVDGKRQSDPYWPWAVNRTIEKYDPECVRINEGVFFRTEKERDKVRSEAEVFCAELKKKFQ